MTAQSAILAPAAPHARFLMIRTLNLTSDRIRQQLTAVLSTLTHLQTQHAEALRLSIGFGPELWQQLHGSLPSGYHQLQPISGAAFDMPVTPADLFIHISGDRADLCFALAQSALQGIQAEVQVLDEKAGFRYLDKRDLTGFIDGTENPQEHDERRDAALLDETQGAFTDGSFVFVQRFVHHLDAWNHMKVDAQEQVIGRSKPDSVEMDDDEKPENAHIARVVIEEDGEEQAILRQSLPYGDASGDQGLFFLAYTNKLHIIDTMLANMFGSAGDGVHDRLLHFTTPVNGAYFFAPSQELLEKVIGS